MYNDNVTSIMRNPSIHQTSLESSMPFTVPTKDGQTVSMPSYRRDEPPENVICHIGVGGFSRAHLFVYMDELSHKGGTSWGICGVGLMEGDKRMYDLLKQQDYLFSVTSRGPTQTSTRVIGSLRDFVFAPPDRSVAVEKLADPSTKIVSLTVTEKGYTQNDQGLVDLQHPLIAHDLTAPEDPQSALGLITAALRLRFERGIAPFTVMSCDNVQCNGDKAQALVHELAAAQGGTGEFMEFVGQVCFPNTMVDRITPATTVEDVSGLMNAHGLLDSWPVVAEEFMQWVVEDKFVNGEKPDFASVGAIMAPSVKEYEFMKLRLLNGGHSALAYPSYMLGYEKVDEAMADPAVLKFVRSYMDQVKSSVPAIPGVDIDAYVNTLIERFGNPNIKDMCMRLAQDGSAKAQQYIGPPAMDLIKAGKPVDRICMLVGAWFHFCKAENFDGQPHMVDDPASDALVACATAGDVRGFVNVAMGPELAAMDDFVAQIEGVVEKTSSKQKLKTALLDN